MILHIFDNLNFVNHTQIEFNKCANKSEYIIIKPDKPLSPPLFHLNEQQVIERIKKKQYHTIVIHNLTAAKAKMIELSGFEKNIHWSAWGSDIYNTTFGFSSNEIYDKKTSAFLKSANLKVAPSVYRFLPEICFTVGYYAYKVMTGKHHPTIWIKKILPKVTSFSTVIPGEKKFIASKIPQANFKDFCYVNTKSLLPKTLELSSLVLGSKIIVGNSAAVANNHLSIMDRLEKFQLLIPFSYGSESYKSHILNDYSHRANFEFLDSPLPYDDYVAKLMESNTMIINTKRQQALGNILLGLSLGMRVYLNSANPTLKFLKGLQIHVFDFWKDFDTYENTPLSDSEIVENRKGLETYWGTDASTERMKNFDTGAH